MAETVAQIEARLTAIRTAITDVLTGGQSRTVNGVSIQMPPLDSLYKQEKALELKLSRMADSGGSGAAIISDFSHTEGGEGSG